MLRALVHLPWAFLFGMRLSSSSVARGMTRNRTATDIGLTSEDVRDGICGKSFGTYCACLVPKVGKLGFSRCETFGAMQDVSGLLNLRNS